MTESQEVALPTNLTAHRPRWSSEVFQDQIENCLREFIDSQASWLGDLGEDTQRLLEHARISVSGGKRLRASFCWWGHLALEEPASEAAARALVRACAALELLHASALVHDDYMDASDVRRGRPATHRAFETLHRERGWNASPEHYGAAAAILLGDLLLSWSDELLRTCGLPADRVLDALSYFDLTRTEVVAGQFLDVSAQARATTEVEIAMQVLRYKSAKYSVERPLHIGAALAGAGPETIEQLTSFGLPLGEAFQLRDDLLGVFGDPAVTGKPAGDDLTEGKRTVLVALALQGLPPAEREHLDRSLGTTLSAEAIAELQALIRTSGAEEKVEALISALTAESLDALAAATISDSARAALGTLVAAATQRGA